MKTRILSLILVLCLLLGLLPVQSLAAWNEELGAQTIDLPIVADGETGPEPQGLGNSISFFALRPHTSGYCYTYEGKDGFYFDGIAAIKMPDGSDYLEENAALAENGVLQMLDDAGKVVAASEAITYYYTEETDDDAYLYRYVSSGSFESNDMYDLSKLADGTYSLQLVAGNTTYPCEGAVIIVDSASLLLEEAYIQLYSGANSADLSLELYGFQTEKELDDLSFSLLDSGNNVVGTSTGNYRDINVYESYGVSCWNLETELKTITDYVILEEEEYTLQIAYTGEKDLYDGVGHVETYVYTPIIQATSMTVLDPQTGCILLCFENWEKDVTYIVNVYNSNEETIIGTYTGEIPSNGEVELQLGVNGIPTPMTAFSHQLNVEIFEEGNSYSTFNDGFNNPYYNLNSNNGYASFSPSYISTTAESLDFTLQGDNYYAYLGKNDVVTLQDSKGNTVATCNDITELNNNDGRFQAEGSFIFTEPLNEGRYYVFLNGVQLRSVTVTSNLRMSTDIPFAFYDDETFFLNFGVFPVSFYGINSSGKGSFTLYQVDVQNEGSEEEDSEWTQVLTSDIVTGTTCDYDGYLEYNYNFTAQQFEQLSEGNYYVISFHDVNGGQVSFDLGYYDATHLALDLSNPDLFYFDTSDIQTGDSNIPMELYTSSGDLRNMVQSDLDVVKQLTILNRDTEETIPVSGYSLPVSGTDDGYAFLVDLTLSTPLPVGRYCICYGEEELHYFTISENTEEEQIPTLYDYNNLADNGYIEGRYLPEGNYTAKLYDGYTCLTEQAFNLTLKSNDSYTQHLTYSDEVFAELSNGNYEMRVYLDGNLLDSVTITKADMSKPIVALYDARFGYADPMRIHRSGYYAFNVENAGLYTKLRASESIEGLEKSPYLDLQYSYRLNDVTTPGERTIYAQLQTADGSKETGVLSFPIWFMGGEETVSISVPDDLQGVYGGDQISFVFGAETRMASAKMDFLFSDGSSSTESLRYKGFDLLPQFTPEVVLESAHPYAANSNQVWTYTVNGAGSLKVTFSSNSYLGNNDYLEIYAGEISDDTQLYRYTGSDLSSKTLTIPGDTILLRLVSDDNVNTYDYGFAVTSITGSDTVIELEKYVLQSYHPYESYTNKTWSHTVDGAENIAITFSALTAFEETYDYLTVYAGQISEKPFGVYSGDDLAGVTLIIPGDTVTLHLTSDSGVNYYGFAVTSITDADTGVTEEPASPVLPDEAEESEFALPASAHPFGAADAYACEFFSHTVEGADTIAVTFSEETALNEGGYL